MIAFPTKKGQNTPLSKLYLFYVEDDRLNARPPKPPLEIVDFTALEPTFEVLLKPRE